MERGELHEVGRISRASQAGREGMGGKVARDESVKAFVARGQPLGCLVQRQ